MRAVKKIDSFCVDVPHAFFMFFFIINCSQVFDQCENKFTKLLFDCFQLKQRRLKEGNNKVKFLSTCSLAYLVDL